MAKKKRAVPEINAGSMADIAFLLLIFFLVTTTMDANKGINRKLPPYDPDQQVEDNPIKERNIFTVLINSNNDILIENEYGTIDVLRDKAVEFLLNNGDGTCDYCQGGLRNPESSDNPHKAVISLQNDKGTAYKVYLKVQNELMGAYTEVRNKLSNQWYGKNFDELTDEDQIESIKEAFPQIISEAEPLNLG